MVHEQKLKDRPSSTCQISPERTVLDLESEALEAWVQYSLGVRLCVIDFIWFYWQLCVLWENSNVDNVDIFVQG